VKTNASNLNEFSILKVLLHFSYAIFLFFICLFAYRKPVYNWDMLAYMAIVIKMDHHDINQIHKITYSTAKINIPSVEYGYLITSPYREKMADSPSDFYAQLPFYAVKPLYIGMVYLFYKAGCPLTISTVLPSIFGYFLVGLLLFHWLKKYCKLFFAFIYGVLIMYSPFIVNIARISTPDGLSTFLLFTAFYFIVEKPSIIWMSLFFILAVFVRLDNIITCFFILSFLLYSDKWQKSVSVYQYILILLLLIISYFSITLITIRPFGWNILYYPTFVQYYNLSHQFHVASPLKAYLALLYSQAITAVVFHNFTLFTLLVLVIVSPFSVTFHNLKFDQLFSLLLISIIVGRFILYPDLADRFYISFYLCILVSLIKKYTSIQVIQPILVRKTRMNI